MQALSILTAEGIPATAAIEAGAHGGDVLAIRTADHGFVLLAVKVEHATPAVLGSLLDPGTVGTVQGLLS